MIEFSESVEVATATIGDVAKGIGRARRTVHQYLAGERTVTSEAARAMAAYLRLRSEQLTAAADRLEAAMQQEEQEVTDSLVIQQEEEVAQVSSLAQVDKEEVQEAG